MIRPQRSDDERPQTVEGAVPSMSRRADRWRWELEQFVVLLIYAGVFAAVYTVSIDLRFDGVWPEETRWLYARTLPMVVLLKLLAVILRGSHRGWRHRATFADLVSQAEAAILGSLAVAAVSFGLQMRPSIPRLVIVFDGFLTVATLCALRGSLRLIQERYLPMIPSKKVRKRVLVVGAHDAGLGLVKEIQAQPKLGLKVVGVVDPSPDAIARGRVVSGVDVVGGVAGLRGAIDRTGAELVLIPTPATPPRQLRTLVEACNAAGVKAQVVPGFDALLSGNLTFRPRDVAIDDLLGREPVRLLDDSIARLLKGKRVLVTGGAGSIGSEISRQVLDHGAARLVLYDTYENGLFHIERELNARAPETEIVPIVGSVTDAEALRGLFDEHQPHVVIHAAAHKHVPMMERNPGASVLNNAIGTRTLVDESVKAGVEVFVLISTDKAVNPTSVMGATKRLAEMYVQALAGRVPTRLVAVRFGNVLGSNGSVVPTFVEQIRWGGPVTVTHPEMTRYFMTIPEASQLVLQAAAIGDGGEIFVLDMGQPVRIVDLATDLIRLSGLEPGREIEIQFTGLRPGEKLFEELHDPDEPLEPTKHPKIGAARIKPVPLPWINDRLAELRDRARGPREAILEALAAVVPGYQGTPIEPAPEPASVSEASKTDRDAETDRDSEADRPIVPSFFDVNRFATS